MEKRAVLQLMPWFTADEAELHLGVLISHLSTKDGAVALDVGVYLVTVSTDDWS